MAELARILSPNRRLFLGGLVVGVALILLFQAWFGNHGITFYRTHIDKSAKGLIESVGCTSMGPGTFAVNGIVTAKADTGVLKIGATIYFGTSNRPGSIQASPTYFDTDDTDLDSLVPQFFLVAYNGEYENSQVDATPKYCSIYLSTLTNP
jgi:hypothetical protein